MLKLHRIVSRLTGTHALVLVLLTSLMLLMLPACMHEPVLPVDPDPNDTIDNPMDTMDMDTIGEPCNPDIVYFEKDILPILRSNCAKSGCHDAITHEKDIILNSYTNVMASDVVRAFDLNSSDLYEVITETDPDKRMPQPPNERLTTDQITIIAKWILQGAKDLSCDVNAGICDTTNVTYSGFIAPLLANTCVGCHSGDAPSGGISLNTHAGVESVALNGRLIGAITWASGYKPMPFGAAKKLPECTIDKIKAWVHDGARNN